MPIVICFYLVPIYLALVFIWCRFIWRWFLSGADLSGVGFYLVPMPDPVPGDQLQPCKDVYSRSLVRLQKCICVGISTCISTCISSCISMCISAWISTCISGCICICISFFYLEQAALQGRLQPVPGPAGGRRLQINRNVKLVWLLISTCLLLVVLSKYLKTGGFVYCGKHCQGKFICMLLREHGCIAFNILDNREIPKDGDFVFPVRECVLHIFSVKCIRKYTPVV